MKQGLYGVPIGATVLTAIAQPVWAAPIQVTAIQLQPTASGIQLVLSTQGSSPGGSLPSVFTVISGNSAVADVTGTQLRLAGGQPFRQNNPAPGIASVLASQLDANTVRVTVSGTNQAPATQVIRRNGSGVVLGFTNTPVAQARTSTNPNSPQPNLQPSGLTPPLLPRAVPPPVGDIVVAPIDSAPDSIDLDSSERIPKLLLREAPAREVLALLARAAGLNLAFSGDAASGANGQEQPSDQVQDTTQAQDATNSGGPRISLDIEDEPVEDVFNYVLRLTGLEANRVGRTVFVGPRLPDAARNIVSRTYRLNQVSVAAAASFLTAQGAVTQITRDRVDIQSLGEGAAARIIETRTPEVLALKAEPGVGPLLLSGLSVLTNERLNSITLVGTPRKVEVAAQFLTQLDLRRRQVAVNVKIIDINLLNTKDLNSSFSFGAGRSFFTIDNGAAVFNFGRLNPPSADLVRGSLTSPPTIPNPLTGTPFLGEGFFNRPGRIPSALPPVDPNANPAQPGITDFTPGTPPTATSPGTPDIFEFGLPSLFQYPLRLLSLLRAQITSGNAKILTDPTLTIQEGETSTVNLTEEVFGGFEIGQAATSGSGPLTTSRRPIIKNAGLTVPIRIERIDDNGFVSMTVAPNVSSIGGTQATADGPITLLNERRLNSGLIRIRDGQTLVLTGIIQDSDRTTVSKVPILGDIPLLGRLFRSTGRTRQRQEVIVLVTPKVLDDSNQATFGYQYTPSPEAQKLLNPKR